MAVNYETAVKTARMNAVLTEIGNAGKVRVYTTGGSASGTLLAEFTLPTPSGTVSGTTLTFDIDPDINEDNNAANNSGTAAVAEIFKSDGTTKCVTGLTVGTGGQDITISPSTSITAGQQVTLVTLSIAHA